MWRPPSSPWLAKSRNSTASSQKPSRTTMAALSSMAHPSRTIHRRERTPAVAAVVERFSRPLSPSCLLSYLLFLLLLPHCKLLPCSICTDGLERRQPWSVSFPWPTSIKQGRMCISIGHSNEIMVFFVFFLENLPITQAMLGRS